MANDAKESEEPFNLKEALLAACQTVPDNLTAIADKLLDPLGLGIGDVTDVQAAAEQQEVTVATFEVMQSQFDGQIGAFGYSFYCMRHVWQRQQRFIEKQVLVGPYSLSVGLRLSPTRRPPCTIKG